MKNRIKELREAQNLTARALAAMAGTSPSQISRLEKSKRKLSLDWILRLSGALKVPPNDLVNIDLGAPVPASCDQALMGTVIGFLFEACDQFKAKPTPKEIAAWITFIYNDAVQHGLTFPQTRELATTIVKVSQKNVRPEVLVTEFPAPDAQRKPRKAR